MPYVLTIATPEGRDLVVAALRTAADQRTRVARSAAGKVAEQKRAGRDVRSSAVKVTTLLAEADVLVELAAELETLEELAIAIVTPAPQLAAVPIPDPTREPTAEELAALREQLTGDPAPVDDGTSPQAQALAAAAGLEDAIVEDGVDTGAIAEDDVDEPEDVLG